MVDINTYNLSHREMDKINTIPNTWIEHILFFTQVIPLFKVFWVGQYLFRVNNKDTDILMTVYLLLTLKKYLSTGFGLFFVIQSALHQINWLFVVWRPILTVILCLRFLTTWWTSVGPQHISRTEK